MKSPPLSSHAVAGVLGGCILTVVLLLVLVNDGRRAKVTIPVAQPNDVWKKTDSLTGAGPQVASRDERLRPSDLAQDPTAPAQDPPAASSTGTSDKPSLKEDLAFFATDSLNGVMHLNAVLESVIPLASLTVEPHPDFEYEDDDAIAYAIKGVPAGIKGHLLVGLQPYTENGRTYRYLQMDIDIPTEEPEYLDGAVREGPNVNLSISYDVADPDTPTRFALMLQRPVDLYESRRRGIDAYHGEYTQGVYYWHDLLDTTKVSATTFGIVNGNPADAKTFLGARPASGDLRLDEELLKSLLAQLQKNLASVKGE